MAQVEKVAHAIMKADEQFSGMEPKFYDFLAEQAIIAMRQPTEEMLEAVDALPRSHNRLDMWCAMIDVALGRLVLEKGDAENGEQTNSFGYDD